MAALPNDEESDSDVELGEGELQGNILSVVLKNDCCKSRESELFARLQKIWD